LRLNFPGTQSGYDSLHDTAAISNGTAGPMTASLDWTNVSRPQVTRRVNLGLVRSHTIIPEAFMALLRLFCDPRRARLGSL